MLWFICIVIGIWSSVSALAIATRAKGPRDKFYARAAILIGVVHVLALVWFAHFLLLFELGWLGT